MYEKSKKSKVKPIAEKEKKQRSTADERESIES